MNDRECMGAPQAASEQAMSCIDYSPIGGVVPVKDQRAIRALESAFAAMIRQGCKPLVLQIAPEVARAFPRSEGAALGNVALLWLAVGIDGQGLGTYALRWLRIDARDGSKQRQIAELAMLAELSCETGRQGFPMGQAKGRA